ncbi:CAP domain-containing protein [Desulfovirgula thermocuniculi]|uniref:CAP domain-containing protein n=1 Tax=Desulfovirgula thermocuniculi TaxID=348842 RepID=UPI0004168EE5|nr:CAP domain-containing protein [Desulfovirgula thermocuniculi]
MRRGARLLFSLLVAAVLFGGLCLTAAYAQEVGLSADEARLVDLINQWRAGRGLDPWQVDPLLVDVARERARDVARQGFAALSSPPLAKVMAQRGVRYEALQESAFATSSVSGAFNALIKLYPAYRQVVESADLERVGVGVAKSGKTLYVVQLAAGRKVAEGAAAPAPAAPPQQAPPQPAPGTPAAVLTADEQRMVELVNAERARYGLPALKVNPQLVQLARLKAKDMVENNYFSHTSPTYGSPFEMMRKSNVTYLYAGENLAGASTVEAAHQALMNSPGHRANILNPNFKEIGIAVVPGSVYGKIFVQLFKG